ncbi:MAG TPA: hypothetical protein VFX16_27465 [Pseudonocardiaceae bacterium]|nr:hypothetical protein [Pseudonocardiaceae bacterium]
MSQRAYFLVVNSGGANCVIATQDPNAPLAARDAIVHAIKNPPQPLAPIVINHVENAYGKILQAGSVVGPVSVG